MSLYIYCLSEEAAPNTFDGVSGIGGAMIQVISCGAINAVVSEHGSERAEVTRDNVIAHEEIINRALAGATPIPCRFGTIVTAGDLRNYVYSHNSKLETLFAKVRGAVEMNIRVIRDKTAIKGESAVAVSATQSRETLSPGRAFLLSRQREIRGDETLRKDADEIASWLDDRLSDLARETSMSVRPAEALVIKAAHLVERSQIDLYRERVRSVRKERIDLRFMMSGPWPPYSFADLRS